MEAEVLANFDLSLLNGAEWMLGSSPLYEDPFLGKIQEVRVFGQPATNGTAAADGRRNIGCDEAGGPTLWRMSQGAGTVVPEACGRGGAFTWRLPDRQAPTGYSLGPQWTTAAKPLCPGEPRPLA